MKDTPFKKAIDVYVESERYQKASDPTTLGALAKQRQFLENRLHGAFSAGWTAHDDETARLNLMLMNAISACVHYQEYIDTDMANAIDLATSQLLFTSNQDLMDWIGENKVLLPHRRDSVDFLDALNQV